MQIDCTKLQYQHLVYKTEIDELIIFVRKHLMVEYIITGNPQREERYDYPLDAIREIV